jgi:hypothetical protein
MIARMTAVAIAIAAVIDPAVPIPRSARPPVRVDVDASQLIAPLADAGFLVNTGADPAATVVVGDRIASPPALPSHSWILDTSPGAPNVQILFARAATTRLPGQALDVEATFEGRGAGGRKTTVVLEDGGIPVARVEHQWRGDRERWTARFDYLVPAAGSGRVRVRAESFDGESSAADNATELAVPPLRGPLRTLVVEAAVSWPALFVRRVLEGESAFAVSAVQRATKSVATRAGAPPPSLTRATLSPYEVVIVGGPASLSAADLDALRWFIESRGGIVLLVPDVLPGNGDSPGFLTRLLGNGDGPRIQAKMLEAPVRVGQDLLAAEFVTAQNLPADVKAIATDPEGHPVVFARRVGAGGVIFSGALDAWRHRGGEDDGYARFWRRVIASAAATVPPALAVETAPAIVRPGDPVTVTARLRDTELPRGDRIELTNIRATAVSPSEKVEEPIRLWPSAEPGVFVGEWRAREWGATNVTVSAGDLRADAVVTVASDAATPHLTTEDLDLAARATGGRAMPVSQGQTLVEAMKAAYPASRVTERRRIMRSAWWSVPFAALLCVEWALRRKRGQP